VSDPAESLRAIHRGHSPNCSAVGSFVGTALFSAVAAAAVWNAFADRFRAFVGGAGGPGAGPGPGSDAPSRPEPVAAGTEAPRLRDERDGALLAWPEPPALLALDAAGAAAAHRAGARPWGSGELVPGALSAPVELHVAVTERCPARCTGCYLSAGPAREHEPAFDAIVASFREAAAAGVFEVALGGGEASVRSDILRLAAAARAEGLVPNLTTSGFAVHDGNAAAFAAAFGQVNVSIDGLRTYTAVRGWDGGSLGMEALTALSRAGARTGVNTVLSKQNVDELEALGEAIAAAGAREWQWLRWKPVGRGATAYHDHALGPEEADSLLPRALALEAKLGLPIRFDCALTPFLVAHRPDPALLSRLGVLGCVAGERLLVRGANGGWQPCSFLPEVGRGPLREVWRGEALVPLRRRAEAPPEPCASCEYRAVCRGGCRAVAAFAGLDPLAPDPECPRVRAA
jgi:radical SAM protein with 4Fe4S-binding SPASM domain